MNMAKWVMVQHIHGIVVEATNFDVGANEDTLFMTMLIPLITIGVCHLCLCGPKLVSNVNILFV
jgi:hypothetical protein